MATDFEQLLVLAERELPGMERITPRTLGHRLNVGSNRALEVIEKLVAQGLLEIYHGGLGNKSFRLAKPVAAA